MKIPASLILLGLLACMPAQGTSSAACELSPEVRAEVAKITKSQTDLAVSDPSDFEKNVGPLLALRQRHPNDLLVHELYQDAVERHGIEGHLRKLTEEYQVLSMQHSDEVMYDYLYARSLIGRNTTSAIRQINEILAQHPDFASGHRSLAEIYSSAAFRNSERKRWSANAFSNYVQDRRCSSFPAHCPIRARWSTKRSACWPATAIPTEL